MGGSGSRPGLLEKLGSPPPGLRRIADGRAEESPRGPARARFRPDRCMEIGGQRTARRSAGIPVPDGRIGCPAGPAPGGRPPPSKSSCACQTSAGSVDIRLDAVIPRLQTGVRNHWMVSGSFSFTNSLRPRKDLLAPRGCGPRPFRPPGLGGSPVSARRVRHSTSPLKRAETPAAIARRYILRLTPASGRSLVGIASKPVTF
jgi:hypothetical protein